MDFFYHCPSITTKVSVGFVNNWESNFVFFDHINIGSEDLKRILPGLLSDLAVNVSPEPIHPAFPSAGLAFWVAPPEGKVSQASPLIELSVCDQLNFAVRMHLVPPRLTIARYRTVINREDYMPDFSYFSSTSDKGCSFCSD